MHRKAMQRMMAVCLVAVFALAAGCNKNDEESSSGSSSVSVERETVSPSDENMRHPLEFVYDTGENDENESSDGEDATEGDATEDTASGEDSSSDASGEDSSSGDDSGDEPETVIEEITEYETVTDAAGEPVTDADGEPATQAVVRETKISEETPGGESSGSTGETVIEEVTEYVPVTDAEQQPVTNAIGEPETEAVVKETIISDAGETEAESSGGTYTGANPDKIKAIWYDTGRTENFYFDGEFLVLEFEIKDGVPNGSYPVAITYTDIVSWELNEYSPTLINGEVAVGQEPEAQEDAKDGDFTLKVNSAQGNPGDTVTITVDITSNPGIVGSIIDLQYDKNALTIVSAEGGESYHSTVNY